MMFEPSPRTQLASDERPIGLRTRPDLTMEQSAFQGERSWIVKDPLAMKFYRLRDAEYRILENLREDTSYLALKRMLAENQPDKTIRFETIQNLVLSLYRSGLLISTSTGQTTSLDSQRKKERKQKVIGRLAGIASHRFPGIDPTRILTFLYPKVSWIYTPWFSCFVAFFCLSAALLLLSNLDEFTSRLPEFQQFFAVNNLLLMGVILIFTKSIHELGHGLMCKRFGGECQEIGFMLLLMTPAMYCNTSDSWILPNRWHRIAISAGGMYLELILSAICTFVWWYTNPGWIHYISLNIMFLCSCSTVLFNGNPLLRLDGYYMLSDYLEIPNLNQKSQRFLQACIKKYCFGNSTALHRYLPLRHRFVFVTYCLASATYRWIVFFGVYWFLRKTMEPHGMVVLANLICVVSIIGMLANPIMQCFKYLGYPGRASDLKRKRVLSVSALAVGLVLFACFVPIPEHIYGPVRIRPFRAQSLLVSEPGVLRSILVNPGDPVKKGEVVAVLENPLLEQQFLALQGELASLNSDLIGFLGNQNTLIDSERLVVETKVAIRSLEAKIATKRSQLDRLTLRADRDGLVLPPTNVPSRPLGEFELPQWTGIPLEAKNLGSYLAPNTLVCLIAAPNAYEAVVLVDQSDVQMVQPKQHVKLLIEQSLDQTFSGYVTQVSHNELTSVPMELSQANGGMVAVKTEVNGQQAPILKMYEIGVHLPLEENAKTDWLSPGHSGLARIHAGFSPLASIAMRHLRNVVNFR